METHYDRSYRATDLMICIQMYVTEKCVCLIFLILTILKVVNNNKCHDII